MRTRHALLAGVAACGLLGLSTSTANAAGPYDFVVIADSADGYHPDWMGCPQLSDDGGALYTTRMLDEPKRYQLWRWSDGDSELLAQKPQRGGGFLSLSSNESGEFATKINRPVDGDLRGTVYRSDGTETVKVAVSGGPLVGFINESLITESGRIALTRELDGLYLARRLGHETPVYNHENSDFRDISWLAVRDDMIAFTARVDGVPGYGSIYLRSGDGTLTVIAGPLTPGLETVAAPSIGTNGDVAFGAELDAGGYAVMVGDGGPPQTVADSTGLFSYVGGPSLNAAGTVVFEAALDPPGSRLGVYSGPDSQRDAILKPGEPFAGSTVYEARSCSLNDAGQVGISVELDDGRSLVVRADPS